MTGWRVGWMIGPGDVIEAATNLQSHVTSNVANVSQPAALAAVSGDLEAVAEMRACLRPAASDHPSMLNEIDGVSCLLPEGAFYAFPSVDGLSVAKSGAAGARPALSSPRSAIEEAKVAVVPGEAFGAPGYFRLSYALGDDDSLRVSRRLAKLFGEAA